MDREQVNNERIEIEDETADVSDLELKSGKKVTVAIKIVRGKLHAQLFDHTGEKILSNMSYTCKGPYGAQLDGTTDASGILKHDNVPLGVYEAKINDKYKSNIPAVQSDAEIHRQIVEEYNENSENNTEETTKEPELEAEENPTFKRNMTLEEFMNPPTE